MKKFNVKKEEDFLKLNNKDFLGENETAFITEIITEEGRQYFHIVGLSPAGSSSVFDFYFFSLDYNLQSKEKTKKFLGNIKFEHWEECLNIARLLHKDFYVFCCSASEEVLALNKYEKIFEENKLSDILNIIFDESYFPIKEGEKNTLLKILQ